MTATILRRDAAQSTLDAYQGQPFAWGRRDCIRMAAHVLKALGYKPRLSRGGYYGTALGARKALKKAGFDTIEAALDGLGLSRVPYAFAMPGDIVALPSAEDWPALGVVVAPGRVLAFSPHDGLCRLCAPAAEDVKIVWSAPPCRKPR